jgi:hypothetical protein
MTDQEIDNWLTVISGSNQPKGVAELRQRLFHAFTREAVIAMIKADDDGD